MNSKILLGTAAFLMLGASCQNTLNEPNLKPGNNQVNLVKVPEVTVWSGEQILGYGIYSTRASESGTYTKWQSDRGWENIPEDPISVNEKEYVLNYIKEHPNEGYDICDLTSYYIQNVGGSYDEYDLYFNENNIQKCKGSEEMNLLKINGIHINDFNAATGGGNWGLCENMPLNDPFYQESYANTEQHNKYKFYYIEYNGKMNVYLCFDYATEKYDNGQMNFEGDGVYNDWVIKLSPANGSNIVPPTSSENCDKCGHPKHGDYCNDCKEGDSCYKEEVIENPDTPIEVPEHVEINLSIEERDGVEWLASHLSIHVRANTDVEVFIPLPAVYYCAVDDLAIVAKHEEDLMIHSGPQTTTFTINGDVVSMTVSFENEGIRINTNGINENIISYLNETYGDGLTFEVWNYMNLRVRDWDDATNNDGKGVFMNKDQENEITAEQLRGFLNKSTVKFSNTPDLYVNAFMFTPGCEEEEHECGAFIDDCTVSIVSTQSPLYELDRNNGYWYNGSPYNQLWWKD